MITVSTLALAEDKNQEFIHKFQFQQYWEVSNYNMGAELLSYKLQKVTK